MHQIWRKYATVLEKNATYSFHNIKRKGYFNKSEYKLDSKSFVNQK